MIRIIAALLFALLLLWLAGTLFYSGKEAQTTGPQHDSGAPPTSQAALTAPAF